MTSIQLVANYTEVVPISVEEPDLIALNHINLLIKNSHLNVTVLQLNLRWEET